MERWGVEEITHGEVINRFLNEAGIETSEQLENRNPPKCAEFLFISIPEF